MNKDILRQFARDMKKVYPKLNEKEFYQALIKGLDQLELKARIERAADVAYRYLPSSYEQGLNVLYRFVEGKDNKLLYLFLPNFIAKYGQEDYERSIKAIRDFTQYSSSEEGVRIFLELNLNKTINYMMKWTTSKNVHIRRLASEGSRPRLPWAKKISAFIEDPQLAWPILEALKEDCEKYVQKSVANHINDISKDHPDWVVKKVSQWDRSCEPTAWIVKHGMRSLIKRGHKGALKLFGTHQLPKVELREVNWKKSVKIGQVFNFQVEIVSKSKKEQVLMIDYIMHFVKNNGKSSAKVFKLKKCKLSSKESVLLKSKYTFKDLSTRKHYTGRHSWQLKINGEAMQSYAFEVM